MEDKNVPHYLRLKVSHPTLIKFQKLADLADELGLVIAIDGGQMAVYDRDQPYVFNVRDTEQTGWEKSFYSFPPCTEYFIKYENPEYIRLEKIKHEKYKAEQKEKEEQDRAAKLLAEKAAEEERIKVLEEKERKTLAFLKAKYESQI